MKSLVKAHMAIDERKQVRAKGLAERVRAADVEGNPVFLTDESFAANAFIFAYIAPHRSWFQG